MKRKKKTGGGVPKSLADGELKLEKKADVVAGNDAKRETLDLIRSLGSHER